MHAIHLLLRRLALLFGVGIIAASAGCSEDPGGDAADDPIESTHAALSARDDSNDTELAASAPEALTQTKLHPLGAILSPPELMRSKMVEFVPLTAVTALPTSVDLSSKLGPVGDQGGQGSCVGWAVGYATKTLQEVVEMKWPPNDLTHEFSPSWVFNQITTDGLGASIPDALNLLQNKGCDTMFHFPYNQNDWRTLPNAQSRARAAHFKATSWNTLSVTRQNLQNTLAAGNAVIVGFNVLPDFDNLDGGGNTMYDTDAGTRPKLPPFNVNPCNSATCGSVCNGAGLCGTCAGTVCTVPACNTAPCVRGGHAIAIVGYDDAMGAFKFVNSWGSRWNLQGYGWLKYSFITNSNLGLQAFVMTDGTNVPVIQDSTMMWYESSSMLTL